MPTEPKKPQRRNHPYRHVTMSPQALEDYEYIQRHGPKEAWTLSGAIAWAGRIAREKIPEKKS